MKTSIQPIPPIFVLTLCFLGACTITKITPTQIKAFSIVPSSTSTPSISSSPTPTMTATPNPILSADNADRIKLLATLGKGKLFHSSWSLDGKSLAVSSSSGITFYDSQTFSEIGNLKTEFLATYFSFLPDNANLLIMNDQGGIFIYRISDGKRVTQFSGGPNPIVDISSDGKILAVKANSDVIVYRMDTGRLFCTLKGSEASIMAIVFSPDGKWLATGSNDNILHVWDVSNCKQIKTSLLVNGVNSIAFTSDGQTIAIGGQNSVVLWRVSNWSSLRIIPISEGLDHLAISPDGKILATQSYSKGTVTLRNMADDKISSSFQGDANYYFTRHYSSYIDQRDWFFHSLEMSFSPDGKLLATEQDDNTVHIWHVADGTLAMTLNNFTFPITDMLISPDGSMLNSLSIDYQDNLWSTTDRQILQKYPVGYKNAFSPNGVQIATCCDGNLLKLINLSDGSVVQELKLEIPNSPFAFLNNIVFSSNGLKIITEIVTDRNYNPIEYLWDLSTYREIYSFQGSYAISPDGSLLAYGEYKPEQPISLHILKIMRFPENQLLYSIPPIPDKGNCDIAYPQVFSPDGTKLFFDQYKYVHSCISTDPGYEIQQSVHMFDISSGTVLNTPEISSYGVDLFTTDGNKLINRYGIFSVSDGRLLSLLRDFRNDYNSDSSSIAISPNDEIIAIGYKDGSIQILSLLNGKNVVLLHSQTDQITKLLFSPDGLTLYSSSKDGTIGVWGI